MVILSLLADAPGFLREIDLDDIAEFVRRSPPGIGTRLHDSDVADREMLGEHQVAIVDPTPIAHEFDWRFLQRGACLQIQMPMNIHHRRIKAQADQPQRIKAWVDQPEKVELLLILAERDESGRHRIVRAWGEIGDVHTSLAGHPERLNSNNSGAAAQIGRLIHFLPMDFRTFEDQPRPGAKHGFVMVDTHQTI